MTEKSIKVSPVEHSTKAQIIFEIARRNPRVALLIDRLDCTPRPDPEGEARSLKVQARIEDLIRQWQKPPNLPQVERSIIREGHWSPGQPPIAIFSPEREFQILSYLEATYGPQPWKYPLPNAPF